MNIGEYIIFAGAMLVSLISLIISYFQFKEKGFLFNNAYIYASKKERETMNKKPYYRQSAIVFVFIGLIFLLNSIEIVFKCWWLFWVSLFYVTIAIIYAIASSITIERNK